MGSRSFSTSLDRQRDIRGFCVTPTPPGVLNPPFSSELRSMLSSLLEVAIPDNTVVALMVSTQGGSGSYNTRLTRDAPAVITQGGAALGFAQVLDADFTSAISWPCNGAQTISLPALCLGGKKESGSGTSAKE